MHATLNGFLKSAAKARGLTNDAGGDDD